MSLQSTMPDEPASHTSYYTTLPISLVPLFFRLRFALPQLPRSKETKDEVDLHLHAKDVFERERGVGVSGHVLQPLSKV